MQNNIESDRFDLRSKPTHSRRIIGITGNSGSGKTTVANMIGGHAIDADKVVHKVMETGQPAYKKIVSAFGTDILDSEAKIDRKKLGSIVFSDTAKRTSLEEILHPIVTEEILNEIKNSGELIFTIDAVLLVESGLHHHCDEVWLVTATPEHRLKRIIDRDNLSEEAAQSRMRNQRDTTHIAAIADVVIVNDGDLESLKAQVDRFRDIRQE